MASIFDILNFKGRGIGIGPVQSVDEMTVIPLVGDDRGDVATPESLKFELRIHAFQKRRFQTRYCSSKLYDTW